MSNLKKPIRQFSLQYDSPKIQERRKSLKKQFSEDFSDIQPEPEVNIRISVSNKNQNKIVDRPPPVKVAWSENDKKPMKDENGFVVKKCTEIKKSSTPLKVIRQSSLERESILYSQQELSERLKKALKERETTKTNLNIILSYTTAETKNDDSIDQTDFTNTDTCNDKIETPKIIMPLKPANVSNSDSNMKNVFQKHIRKTVKQKSLFTDSCYSPTRATEKIEERCNTVVVVPVIDNKSVRAPLQRCNSLNKERILTREGSIDNDTKEKNNFVEKLSADSNGENKPNISSRPSTAASRREMFQKRTNSAFHGSIKKEAPLVRPPLLRTTSVPVKQEPLKPKFVATKRRVKTAKPKIKVDESDDDSSASSRRKCIQRCASVAGDVVTMVSLVSPSASENEEEEDEISDDKEKTAKTDVADVPIDNKAVSPVKSDNNNEEDKNFSLRKTVKSVSFQQSSIYAVRSFSASFPGRRCSMAATYFAGNNTHNQSGSYVQKVQEKRAPVSILEDEENVPKRRLVRNIKSAPLVKCTGNEDINIEDIGTKEIRDAVNEEKTNENEIQENISNNDNSSETDTDSSTKFNSPKEKQCWDMYCKMSEKGVAISFDTILRGMLTPTEYRLRRKPSLVPEDNCEITEN